jgi:phospholipid-binding lipoprotein MlaA
MAFTSLSSRVSILALATVSLLTLSACGTATGSEISDPAEGVNRAIFKFNDAVDEAVLEPVARGYRAAVPQPARTGVRNVLRNLESPTVVANNLLQGNVTGAADATTRFAANTFFGLGGLIDIAGMENVRYRDEDFGQTLGVWGIGNSPYVVLPIMGPSSVRDATGMVVDGYTDPLNLWLMNTEREGWFFARVGVATVDKREELLDALADLKKNSIDYYAAVRSAYAQRRAAEVSNEGGDASSLPDIP